MNAQDVIRDVHDDSQHALKTTGTLGAGVNSIGFATVISVNQYSFYQNASLVSGYIYYGFAAPGSNPTTPSFKLQREELYTGSVLFGDGGALYNHTWSSVSLASINYS